MSGKSGNIMEKPTKSIKRVKNISFRVRPDEGLIFVTSLLILMSVMGLPLHGRWNMGMAGDWSRAPPHTMRNARVGATSE
jgi:hypothetical protein